MTKDTIINQFTDLRLEYFAQVGKHGIEAADKWWKKALRDALSSYGDSLQKKLNSLPKFITVSGMDYYLDIFPSDIEGHWVVSYNYVRDNLGYKEFVVMVDETIEMAADKMHTYLEREKFL